VELCHKQWEKKKAFLVFNPDFEFSSDANTFIQIDGYLSIFKYPVKSLPIIQISLWEKKSQVLDTIQISNSVYLQPSSSTKIVWSRSDTYELDYDRWDKNLLLLSYKKPAIQFDYRVETFATIPISQGAPMFAFSMLLLPKNGLVDIYTEVAPTILDVAANFGGLWTLAVVISHFIGEFLNRAFILAPDSRIPNDQRDAILYMNKKKIRKPINSHTIDSFSEEPESKNVLLCGGKCCCID